MRTAASAAEALEALNQSPPDVLISDIGLPEEDGYSLIREVRARESGRGGRIPARDTRGLFCFPLRVNRF